MTVPNVVGYRLDAAHQLLEGAGFDEFDDVDAIEQRTPFLDSNWVVLTQSPKAGQSIEKGTKITLGIAKPEDAGVRSRLPEGSPVYLELKEQDRANASAATSAKKEQAATDKKEATEFVAKLDPNARLAKNKLSVLVPIRNESAANGVVSAADSLSLTLLVDQLDIYWDNLELAPKSRNKYADSIQEAIRSFQSAAKTLQSAEGPAAAGSIQRFDTLFNEAKVKYNAGLTALYAGTGVAPPLL